MPPINSKFSNFDDGGDLLVSDIVVGLRNGVNTRFNYTGGVGVYLPLTGGTMSGAIDMGNNPITNLLLPSAGRDAANKTYVDNAIAGAVSVYLPLAGGTMSGDINMGGFKSTNAADPTNPQDYATKFYVDQNSKVGTQVYAATTTTLNATQSGAGVGATLTDASGTFAAFSVDGVSPPLNSEILNKNQTNAANQGIYTLTQNGDGISIPWVLTRSINYDVPSQINNTGLINVNNGSTLAGTAWYNSTTIVTVDTTNFNYQQFGASFLSSTLASGKIFRGNVSNVAVASTSSFADTYGASQILYSNGANNVVGLATANNGVLSTNGSGVPAVSTTLPSGLTIPSPIITTAIFDSNGNEILSFQEIVNAVNYVEISNNAIGDTPSIVVRGSDTDINMQFQPKGDGGYIFRGTNGTQTRFQFYENQTNGTNSLLLRSPATLANDLTIYEFQETGQTAYPAWDQVSTPEWTNWTPAFTGFSANPTVLTAKYKKIGKTCFIILHMAPGTSNATTFTITNLPFTSANQDQWSPNLFGTNNNVSIANCNVAPNPSSTILTVYLGGNSSGWAAALGKRFVGQFFYETA